MLGTIHIQCDIPMKQHQENFALARNESYLFETIFRARMMTEKHAYKSTGYIQKTSYNYWKK
jgi:hypothetical protein